MWPRMCEPLRSSEAEIREQVDAAGAVSLFLDFDGTLAPIAPDPDTVELEPPVKETLIRLARQEGVVVTVISGRSRIDLRTRVGIEELIYAGNHGLEIRGPRCFFVEPVAAARSAELRRLTDRLAVTLLPFQGVHVENKGLTASVHYRRAAPSHAPLLKRIVLDELEPAVSRFRVASGKKVFEILPRTAWDKGAAVHCVNGELDGEGLLAVYFGDDRTDEDAFVALPEGITVKVGPGPTGARYRASGPGEVHSFLKWLAMTFQARSQMAGAKQNYGQ